MEAFQFSQAKTVNSALEAGRSQTETKFVAGGTTLIDLMKLNVETPKRVVDINPLPLTQIESTSDGGLKIGAMVRNSDLAHDQAFSNATRCFPKLFSPELRRSFETWLLPAAICFSARVATIFAIPLIPATNASPVRDARRWMASTGFTPSLEQVNTALRLILQIWPWP